MTAFPTHRRVRGHAAPHRGVAASRVTPAAWTALNRLTTLAVAVVMTAAAAAMVAAAPDVSPVAPTIGQAPVTEPVSVPFAPRGPGPGDMAPTNGEMHP